MFFFAFTLLIRPPLTPSTPPHRRHPSDFAPTPKNLHTFATDGVRPDSTADIMLQASTMDKKKAELIQIIWTVIKVAVGYLIGYLTNNPEAASQVSAFLNY